MPFVDPMMRDTPDAAIKFNDPLENKQQAAFKDPLESNDNSIWNKVQDTVTSGKLFGPQEAALNIGTGFAAQIPAAIGAGLDTVNKVISGRYKESDPSQVFQDIQRKFTYEPRTASGKDLAEDFGKSGFMQSLIAGGAVAHTMPPVSVRPAFPKISGVAKGLDAIDASKTVTPEPPPVTPEVPPKPPINPMGQMELPDAAMAVAPQYGIHEGMGRIDENGMPIRADLSMEVQNMENPLQRNLWGDELGPALGQERGLTDAIDQMPDLPWRSDRDTAIDQLSHDIPANPELNQAANVADNQSVPREGPFSLPESQRGAIDVNNGSGESAASLEAQSRLRQESDLQRQRMVVQADGTVRPLIGVDAVDYQPKPGETVVQKNIGASQWTVLDSNGVKNPQARVAAATQKLNVPRGQRGGVDVKAVTDSIAAAIERIGSKFRAPMSVEERLSRQPGMGRQGSDLIYTPEPGVLLAEKARTEADGPALYTSFQSGLDHASEKSGSTLMKGTAKWLTYARRMADYGNRNIVQPLERAFKSLSSQEMIDLMEVNRREMFNRKQYTPDELKSAGMSDKQIDTYNKFRKAQQDILATQNAGRAAQGKPPITPQNAYLSSVFQGDYHVVVKDANGNIKWYIQNPTKNAAKAAIAWLKENGEGLDTSNLKVEYKPRPFSDVPRDVIGAYQDALKMFPEDDPVAQRVRSLMEEWATQKGNQFLSQNLHHSGTKANVRGFMGDQPWLDDKANAYNQAKAQVSYMQNALKWAHMQEALSQIKDIISDPELIKNQPNNMETAKAYVMNNMGVSKNMFKNFENYVAKVAGRSSSLVPGLVRDFKGFAYMAQLGASLGYMIATPLQLVPSLAAWHSKLGLSLENFYKDLPLTLSDGFIGVAHDLAKEAGNQFGKTWDSTSGMTQFGKDAYRWAEANSVFATNLFDDNRGLGGNRILAEGKNAIGWTIAKPDQVSRWITFLSFANHLESTGKFTSKDALFQRAAELTEHVATDMHRTSRPLAVDQFGAAGEGAYMYKAPVINMMNNISVFARDAAKGKPGPLLTYLTGMAIMGGVLNLPGVNEVDGLWSLFKDGMAKYKPDWYHHVENTSIKEFMLSHFSDNTVPGEIINWGAASAMTGANMASRFNQSAVDVEHPLRGVSPLGQEFYEQGAIAKAAIHPTRDTIAQAMHVNSPPALKGALESLHPSFKSGVQGPGWTGYRNPNDVTNTDTFVKRSPQEEEIKKLGLTALSEAQRRTKDYVSNQESARVKEAQQGMLDNMFNAIRRNDQGEIEKYARGYFQLHGDMDQFTTEITSKVAKLGMTPAEFKKTHINGISSLNNVMRRISLDAGNQ